jgi:hypothetical protein
MRPARKPANHPTAPTRFEARRDARLVAHLQTLTNRMLLEFWRTHQPVDFDNDFQAWAAFVDYQVRQREAARDEPQEGPQEPQDAGDRP